MKARDIKIAKLTPRDLRDTPEGFEKLYEERRPRPKRQSPLEEPTKPNMGSLLERFGINDS